MTTTQAAYVVFLLLLGAERLLELWLSARNRARAFARGAFEVAGGQYRVMAVFHGAFLVCCALEVLLLGRPVNRWLAVAGVGGAILAQALRQWAIASLGDRWNTRVIVEPGRDPVTVGPYRWVRHPNYVAVAVELAAVPLVHSAWATALAFSLGNAVLLFLRIRAEEAALGPRYADAFSDLPRFVPRLQRSDPGGRPGRDPADPARRGAAAG